MFMIQWAAGIALTIYREKSYLGRERACVESAGCMTVSFRTPLIPVDEPGQIYVFSSWLIIKLNS